MTAVAGRTPDERASAFVDALELEVDVEEVTEVTPPAVLLELAAETRTGVTPAPGPAPLGPEARDFAERLRFALGFEVGWSPVRIDRLIERVQSLMPRGRR